MTIGAGIVGRGMAGTVFHAPLIRACADLELVAMVGATDASALIADPSIALVVIATPNESHYELAARALSARKHVVVDKPFTLKASEGQALIELADRQQRLLTVFHNRRWDGDFLTVRALVEGKRLGRVMLYEAHWDRFRRAIKSGWREEPGEGTGLLFDLGPHLIDQVLVLFGHPDALMADIVSQREDARVDDYFALTLEYGDRRVILTASTLVAQPRPRFALHGTGGSFVKYGLDPQESRLRSGADPLAKGFGADEETTFGRWSNSDARAEVVPTEAGRYLAFYEAVAGAIRRNELPPVDPADAVAGLRIIEQARNSARTGRRVDLRGANDTLGMSQDCAR